MVEQQITLERLLCITQHGVVIWRLFSSYINYHECGAQFFTRRKVTRSGISPLRITLLRFEHFDVAPWLILNETLSSPREGWRH